MTLFGDIPTYLNMYVNIADRRIITLLRTNGLPIRNNLYRIKVENDNVCCKCLSGEKENEIHYLLKCSNYTSIRNKYPTLNEKNDKLPLKQRFITILSCHNLSVFFETIQFVKETNILKRDWYHIMHAIYFLYEFKYEWQRCCLCILFMQYVDHIIHYRWFYIVTCTSVTLFL